jgi:cytoskeletal protein CcmA (bactofilin family)
LIAVGRSHVFWELALNSLNKHITRIGADCKIVGSMTLANDALLLGNFQGRLEVTGSLDAPASAVIQGSLIVGELRLAGHVEGDVLAMRSVHLLSGATLKGRLFTPRLTCDDDATLEALVHVGPDAVARGRAEMKFAEVAVAHESIASNRPDEPRAIRTPPALVPAFEPERVTITARKLDEPAPIGITEDPDSLSLSNSHPTEQPDHDMSVALAHALRDTPPEAPETPEVPQAPEVPAPGIPVRTRIAPPLLQHPVTLPLAVTSFLHRSRAPRSHPFASATSAASTQQPVASHASHDPQTPSRPAHLPPDLSP